MAVKVLATAEEVKEIQKNLPELEFIVHCEHCTVKKAVLHKDGIVWRCPHRTGDVKMEGFCESGRIGTQNE